MPSEKADRLSLETQVRRPTGMDHSSLHPRDGQGGFAVAQKKSQPSPHGLGWDFYFEHKYIPHDMQSSYLRVMVTRTGIEL